METCLIDLGNTRYKWILRRELEAVEPSRRRYAAEDAVDRLCREVFRASGCRSWFVASVRGDEFDRRLAQRFRALGGRSIRFCRIPAEPPFRLAYCVPRQFGIDRYLDLVAARFSHPLPTIVVDAGTAVTVDALDSGGDHLGGTIFPGRALLARSLSSGTALIDEAGRETAGILGDSTAACIDAGARYGFAGALRGIVEATAQRLGGRATIVITGGDAEIAAAALDEWQPVLDPRLLFTGMTLTDPCAI